MKDHHCTLVNINLKGYNTFIYCPVLQYNIGYEACKTCDKKFIAEMQKMIEKEQKYVEHIDEL